jgi:hypothetical protein
MTKRDDLQRRYEAAAHAVQAGVQMELNDDPPSISLVWITRLSVRADSLSRSS